MALCLILELAGDSNELSPNARLHWRTEARLVKKWRTATTLALRAVQSAAEPFFAPRVQITFTLHRGRSLDPDNAASSRALKAIVDSLKGVCFPDDKASCVEYGPIRQVTGPQYRRFPMVAVLVAAMPVERDRMPQEAGLGAGRHKSL